MIYTLTLNPALDLVMETDNISVGETHRSGSEKIFFGGKGVNVSRVLNALGKQSVALGFIGGFTGAALEDFLKKQGIKTDFTVIGGDTRINIKLKGDSLTEINAAGPTVTDEDIGNVLIKLEQITDGDILVLSGSIPRGAPDNIYEIILSKLTHKAIRVVLDTTGDALLAALHYKPFLIKPNLPELEELVGKPLKKEEDIISAAKQLTSKGACNVLVSLGDRGALLLHENGTLHRKEAFKIRAVNPVGAGDSMVAGFIAGMEKDFGYALTLGTAAGAATAAGEDLATHEDIQGILVTH